MANTVGANQPFRYRGYVYDEETGWYYLQSRYYDPTTCRFIYADVLLSTGQDVLGHNSFAYCLNNPLGMIDEAGTLSFWQKIAIGVAVIAVVAVAAAVTVATAGAGSAAACIAVSALTGAVKGAAIGAISGAAVGAATGAVSHRVRTGSWKGAGKAALNGAIDGFADGFMTGAITGAVSGALNPTACFVAGTAVLCSTGYVVIENH